MKKQEIKKLTLKENGEIFRPCDYWNPWAIIVNDNIYELGKIIIYSEKGILFETNAWLGDIYGGNYLKTSNEGLKIEKIKKISKNNIEKNMKDKNNFIINSDCDYEKRYNLYLYYENIYLKYNETVLNDFLSVKVSIFNDDILHEVVLGSRNRKSDRIKYDEKTKENIDFLSKLYNFDNEKYLEKLEEFKKAYLEYQKQVEIEKNYTLENINECFYNEECKKQYYNIMETIGGRR